MTAANYAQIPVPQGMSHWIGVDLDGTLATDGPWKGFAHIGQPVPAMVERVKAWLAEGMEVRIVTARFAAHGRHFPHEQDGVIDVVTPIQEWCLLHVGAVLPVTNAKDGAMVALWDDRAVQVIANTGTPVLPPQ